MDNIYVISNHKYIALGLGVQSTALYYMSSMGELPRCEAAIFVDTGREKKKTLEYLQFLIQWQVENNGIPISIVRKKNLYADLLNSSNSRGKRFSSIPAFTLTDGKPGMLLRQCTGEYKIEQVDKEIRNILHVQNLLGYNIELWKGISLDEIDRMSIPQENWKIHVYPFCGYAVSKTSSCKHDEGRIMRRTDIMAWYQKNRFPIPPKSACVFCPYQSDASYYDMKMNEPEDFEAAVAVDEAIRNSTKKGINSPVYLHSSCRPLRDIEFKPGLPDLWEGECSGGCHT